MISGGIEREQWHATGKPKLLYFSLTILFYEDSAFFFVTFPRFKGKKKTMKILLFRCFK